jgi:hypothetical protein
MPMVSIGKFHEQGDAKWVVIRGRLRGHKDKRGAGCRMWTGPCRYPFSIHHPPDHETWPKRIELTTVTQNLPKIGLILDNCIFRSCPVSSPNHSALRAANPFSVMENVNKWTLWNDQHWSHTAFFFQYIIINTVRMIKLNTDSGDTMR